MKGTIVASMLAASTVAFASSTSAKDQGCSSSTSASNVGVRSSNVGVRSSHVPLTNGDKFAPRFDGLRFIETLVTAHR